MRISAASTRSVILTLFVGSTWTIGYLVAPVLFSTLPDRALAGTVAGRLFQIEAWISLACAVALFLLTRWPTKVVREITTEDRKTLVLIGAIAASTLIGYFALQPFMAALRESVAATGGVMPPDARTQFGLLHGAASAVYLLKSILGLLLVMRLRC